MDNQLVKTDNSLQTIQFTKNKVMIALQGKKIKDCSDMELAATVSASVEKANSDLGLKDKPDEDIDLLKLGIMSECRMSFDCLTLDELKSAIHNGVRGKYGEVFGLSVIQVAKWLAAYMTDINRHEQKKELNNLLEKEVNKEPTPDEKYTLGKELCLSVFEHYQKTNQLPISALAAYSFLNKYEMIDKTYKTGLLSVAIEEIILERQKEIVSCMDIYKRRRLNAELELFNKALEMDIFNKDQFNEVNRTRQKIALRNFFQDLIMNEESLAELIESKRP